MFTPPVNNEKVSISPLSALRLVSNVQLTEVNNNNNNNNNKWVALTSASDLLFFHKVVQQHYSGEMS